MDIIFRYIIVVVLILFINFKRRTLYSLYVPSMMINYLILLYLDIDLNNYILDMVIFSSCLIVLIIDYIIPTELDSLRKPIKKFYEDYSFENKIVLLVFTLVTIFFLARFTILYGNVFLLLIVEPLFTETYITVKPYVYLYSVVPLVSLYIGYLIIFKKYKWYYKLLIFASFFPLTYLTMKKGNVFFFLLGLGIFYLLSLKKINYFKITLLVVLFGLTGFLVFMGAYNYMSLDRLLHTILIYQVGGITLFSDGIIKDFDFSKYYPFYSFLMHFTGDKFEHFYPHSYGAINGNIFTMIGSFIFRFGYFWGFVMFTIRILFIKFLFIGIAKYKELSILTPGILILLIHISMSTYDDVSRLQFEIYAGLYYVYLFTYFIIKRTYIFIKKLRLVSLSNL